MKTLIAFFSRRGENYVNGSVKDLTRGHAELIAEFAQQATGGSLFEIVSKTPYPTDYYACTEVAQTEKEENARPELTNIVTDMDSYESIVLVYPNWWGTMPMPVYTFLDSYDFSGKTILPCCTHEGSGMSNTKDDIARMCPGAEIQKGLAVLGSQASRSRVSVERWLKE